MSLWNLFGSPSLGIVVSEKGVRVGRGEVRGGKLHMAVRGEGAIPAGKSGEEGTKEALTAALKTSHARGGDVTVVLPSRWIYTGVVQPPSGSELVAELRKLLPERMEDLTVQTVALQGGEEGGKGFAALRNVPWDLWQKACVAAGLRIVRVTTAPCVLAAFVGEKAKNALLVRAFPNEEATVTRFADGWPVDESVLPSGATWEDLEREVRAFLEGWDTTPIFVSGSGELLQHLTLLHRSLVKKEEGEEEKKMAQGEKEKSKDGKGQKVAEGSEVASVLDLPSGEYSWLEIALASRSSLPVRMVFRG